MDSIFRNRFFDEQKDLQTYFQFNIVIIMVENNLSSTKAQREGTNLAWEFRIR